jgi:transposase
MPRKRERDAPPVVYRTARCGLRVTRGQRNRLSGLLRSAGDVWCAVLELNRWRRRRQDAPLAGYQELCRDLAASGPAPWCSRRVPKPAGRNFRCPHRGHGGHRDLIAAANIAARNGGGTIPRVLRKHGDNAPPGRDAPARCAPGTT